MKKEIKIKDLKQFGIVFGIILAVFGSIHCIKDRVHVYPWFFIFALVLILCALIAPKILKPVYIVFLKIAHTIGWFNTRVILILVYYVLLVPIGFCVKIFGGDILNRRIDRNVESYWVERKPVTVAKESLEKQF